jgi:hypothetical protein
MFSAEEYGKAPGLLPETFHDNQLDFDELTYLLLEFEMWSKRG